MNLLLEKPADVSALSPLTLAFVGDSVFDLLVQIGRASCRERV